MLDQLRCSGVIEAVRVMLEAYPTRIDYEDIHGRYAKMMGPEILELYVFIHYNWQYDFMRPMTEEIVEAYLKLHGHELLPEDVGSDSESEDDGGDDAAPAPA